jgi:4-oxalocrotonate tautomerase
MPMIQISMIEGRDQALIERCMKAVAYAVRDSLGAPIETIRVIVQQVPSNQWLIGDRTKEEIDREKAATKPAA